MRPEPHTGRWQLWGPRRGLPETGADPGRGTGKESWGMKAEVTSRRREGPRTWGHSRHREQRSVPRDTTSDGKNLTNPILYPDFAKRKETTWGFHHL